MVGDSFVLGLGVDELDRFSNKIEKLNSEWRVDNLGMNGFGPDLMLMALEDVGLNTNPDVICFVIYTDDFRRVHPHYAGQGFKCPRYKIENNALKKVDYPNTHLWDRLHMIQLLRRTLWKFSDMEFRLNNKILERFLELSKEHEFLPIVTFLPGYWNDYDIDILVTQTAEDAHYD